MASDIYNPNFVVHVLDPKLLILNVLRRKNSGLDLRHSDIPELIDPSHPKDFPGRGHQYAIDNEWYFFRRLRQTRKMKVGMWKCHRRRADIWDENQIIGCMRTFTFIKSREKDESPREKDKSPSWILKEFSDLCTSSSSGADPWVLWVIYRGRSKCSTLLSVKSPPRNRGTSGPTQEVGPCVSQNENISNASHLHQIQPNSRLPTMFPSLYEQQHWSTDQCCNMNLQSQSDEAAIGLGMPLEYPNMNQNETPNWASHLHQIQPNSMLPTMFPSLHEQQQHWSTNQHCNMNASLPLLPCCSSVPNIIQEMLDNEVRGSSASQNQSMSTASHPHQSSSLLSNRNEFRTQHNRLTEEILPRSPIWSTDDFHGSPFCPDLLHSGDNDSLRNFNVPDGEEMLLNSFLWGP